LGYPKWRNQTKDDRPREHGRESKTEDEPIYDGAAQIDQKSEYTGKNEKVGRGIVDRLVHPEWSQQNFVEET
jgi:hypothetical protein